MSKFRKSGGFDERHKGGKESNQAAGFIAGIFGFFIVIKDLIFLGRDVKKMKKKIADDPKYQQIQKNIEENTKKWDELVAKKRKENPKYDEALKKKGL
jgi:hypothetical protein|tara:strand:+ start:20 stop:313 length:294 start_codon:yes stop_codon:yes gene_type:complete